MMGCAWPDGISVETLHQEADSIRQWLADSQEAKRPTDVAGTLAKLEGQIAQLRRQLACEVGQPQSQRQPTREELQAQQDILRMLQDTAASLEDGDLPEKAQLSDLTQLQLHLSELRTRYLEMLERCEGFRKELGEAQAEKEAQRRAAEERRSSWRRLVAEHQTLVDQGEAEIKRLQQEAQQAAARRQRAQQEEQRLEQATRQDRVTLEQLRLSVRRKDARSAWPG
ncbi:unnamed protein product [Effrenium voratum]|nr:unnamed protein product [Effrenium voratum]